jgi:hypothetical protein
MDQYVGGQNLDLKNFPATGSTPVGDNIARELALELLTACPARARAAAIAIHERACERGDDAHAALWGAVLKELSSSIGDPRQFGRGDCDRRHLEAART